MVSGNYPQECVANLRSGQLVLMPTDTVWGLVWKLSSTDHLDKVLDFKPPTKEDPLIIIFSDLEELKSYVDRIHPRVETLLSLHKKPLGIIYPQITRISNSYMRFSDVLAFRISHHPPMIELLKEIGEPLVTISGGRNGTFPRDILEMDPGIMDLADHKTLPVLRPQATGIPCVIATYDKSGELLFIRD